MKNYAMILLCLIAFGVFSCKSSQQATDPELSGSFTSSAPAKVDKTAQEADCDCSGPESFTEEFWIHDHRVVCLGETEKHCFQITFANSPEDGMWEVIHDDICGLEYEEGYYYFIQARSHAPKGSEVSTDADRLCLVRVIEKVKSKK